MRRPTMWTVVITVGLVCLAAGLVRPSVRFLREMREKSILIDASHNLNAAGRAALRYAADHEGILPPLDGAYGRLMYARDEMFPEYCRNPYIITSEVNDHSMRRLRHLREDPDAGEVRSYHGTWGKAYIDDFDYIYLGYALSDEEEGLAFVEAYKNVAETGGDFTNDLVAPAGKGTMGSGTFYRLRTDLVNRLREDGVVDTSFPEGKLGEIPVMVERPGHYETSVTWVFFLDGSARVLPYPGPFPMTEKFLHALESLDKMGGAEVPLGE